MFHLAGKPPDEHFKCHINIPVGGTLRSNERSIHTCLCLQHLAIPRENHQAEPWINNNKDDETNNKMNKSSSVSGHYDELSTDLSYFMS